MGFFDKLKAGLSKTKSSFMGGLNSLFSGSKKIDEDFYDELEETLIMSDLGGRTSEEIVEKLRAKVKAEKIFIWREKHALTCVLSERI